MIGQIASQKGCTILQLLLALHENTYFTMASLTMALAPNSVLQDEFVCENFLVANCGHLKQITVSLFYPLTWGRLSKG